MVDVNSTLSIMILVIKGLIFQINTKNWHNKLNHHDPVVCLIYKKHTLNSKTQIDWK